MPTYKKGNGKSISSLPPNVHFGHHSNFLTKEASTTRRRIINAFIIHSPVIENLRVSLSKRRSNPISRSILPSKHKGVRLFLFSLIQFDFIWFIHVVCVCETNSRRSITKRDAFHQSALVSHWCGISSLAMILCWYLVSFMVKTMRLNQSLVILWINEFCFWRNEQVAVCFGVYLVFGYVEFQWHS